MASRLISGGANGVLTAYGLDGKKIGEFVGHEGDVWAVAPSPDGRYLVSGSADQTVRLWDLKTRELLVTIFRGADGEWVIWTPEGFYTGSPGGAKIVGWQINQGPDKAARYITAGQLRKALHRPDLVDGQDRGRSGRPCERGRGQAQYRRAVRKSQAPEVAILSPQTAPPTRNSARAAISRPHRGRGPHHRRRRRHRQDHVQAERPGGRLGLWRVHARQGRHHQPQPSISPRPTTTIEVVAEDKSGKIESLPAPSPSMPILAALQGVPDLYVLAIAADSYRDTRMKLKFAARDAQALAQTLKEAGVGYYRNPPIVKTLFDDEVTAGKVGAAFAELAARSGPPTCSCSTSRATARR